MRESWNSGISQIFLNFLEFEESNFPNFLEYFYNLLEFSGIYWNFLIFWNIPELLQFLDFLKYSESENKPLCSAKKIRIQEEFSVFDIFCLSFLHNWKHNFCNFKSQSHWFNFSNFTRSNAHLLWIFGVGWDSQHGRRRFNRGSQYYYFCCFVH